MKTLEQHLVNYAGYHRDRRNVATHFLGIPMIVLAVTILLSRPGLAALGLWWCPATALALAAALYYLRLDLRLGALMTALLALCLWVAALLAQQHTAVWLGSGVGLFVVGWAAQFVGHAFEGRKPAFVDDLAGLLIGPLFVAAELAFALGMREELRRTVEEGAGAARGARGSARA